jgi:hypothetical protein
MGRVGPQKSPVLSWFKATPTHQPKAKLCYLISLVSYELHSPHRHYLAHWKADHGHPRLIAEFENDIRRERQQDVGAPSADNGA